MRRGVGTEPSSVPGSNAEQVAKRADRFDLEAGGGGPVARVVEGAGGGGDDADADHVASGAVPGAEQLPRGEVAVGERGGDGVRVAAGAEGECALAVEEEHVEMAGQGIDDQLAAEHRAGGGAGLGPGAEAE